MIAGWIDVDPAAVTNWSRQASLCSSRRETTKPGCLAYVIAADPVVDGRIHIYEHWATAADLDAHFQHPNFQATGELLRSQPRLGGDNIKIHVDRTGPVRDPDGSASATYWPDE